MKTKCFIFKFRRVIAIMLAVIIAVFVAAMLIQFADAIKIMYRYWPIFLALTGFYAALTCIDDYINDRILQKF